MKRKDFLRFENVGTTLAKHAPLLAAVERTGQAHVFVLRPLQLLLRRLQLLRCRRSLRLRLRRLLRRLDPTAKSFSVNYSLWACCLNHTNARIITYCNSRCRDSRLLYLLVNRKLGLHRADCRWAADLGSSGGNLVKFFTLGRCCGLHRLRLRIVHKKNRSS
eukprot:COSAG05_NODE_416_length_10031_cov_18.951067_14_plen_162_part_00